MLTEEEEKEFFDKMDNIAGKYIREELQKPPMERGDAENLSFVFTYKQTAKLVKLSESLVKHSKSLTCWTIVIAVTTLALIFSTITQIVLEFI